MPELLEDNAQGTLESTTIGIYRTSATVKGGRRFSFGAMVVVGDRHGKVGLGYGKAPGVPAAIEKAQKNARRNLMDVVLNRSTLPHETTGRFLASSVRLMPASPGTGVIAGGTVRAVLELAGVKDVLTKAYGSTNQKNLAKAVIDGLEKLRTRETVAALRGVTIDRTTVDEKIELGEKFAPAAPAEGDSEKAKAPVNVVGKDKSGGRGRGGRGGRGGRDGGQQQQQQAPEAAAPAEQAPPTDAPAAQAPTPAEAEAPAPEATEEKSE